MTILFLVGDLMPGIGLAVKNRLLGLWQMLAPRMCKQWTGGELGSIPAFREDDAWFLFP